MTKAKQTDRVLDYMRENGSISQMEAFVELGIFRLASRISDLKRAGYAINSQMEAVTNRYGEKCHIKRYTVQEGNND